MLASIHPLGERGRRQRWGLTITAYLAATILAAAAAGGTFGLLGGALDVPAPARLTVALVLAVIGVALDLRLGGLTVPTVHRQVNERWLDEYRGWVYGAGYGFQLGLGVTTVVSTFGVYLALSLALLAGSVPGGLAVGTTFGIVRGASIFAAAGVRGADELRRLHRRLQQWDGGSRRLAVGVQALAAAGVLTVLMTA